MDANTVVVLAGLVIVGIAWTVVVVGTLAALVRDAFDVRARRPRGPAQPPRRRRAPRRRGAKAVRSSGEALYRPLSWEAVEGK
jgi:hypothetical protein